MLAGDRVVPPSDTTYVRGDGSFIDGWTSRLPEEMSDSRDKLGRYRSVTDLAKAYINAERTIGKKGVIIPGQNATPEEMAAFDKALGVPEKAEDYGKLRPEKIPRNVSWSPEIEKIYFDYARQNHIPAETMRGLMNLHAKQLELHQQQFIKGIDNKRETGRASLRHVWRDDYDKNIATAQRVAHKYGVSPDHEGWTPEMTRLVVAMAKANKEDTVVTGTSAPMGMHDMLAQARDIQTNPMNAEYKRYREGDPEVRAKVRRYLELGTPKGS